MNWLVVFTGTYAVLLLVGFVCAAFGAAIDNHDEILRNELGDKR
ncbi:hypothetical protein Lesp02_70250 [Lentzea sp. NBRC 105346]|nr:hypothetical protein [Lentzea sp. NBRC 105346]GLZ34838.1 hypothetical protein Lesp02_70250 [Lentzea sp. NBRC 105346]